MIGAAAARAGLGKRVYPHLFVGSGLGHFLSGVIGLEAYGTPARLVVGVAGAVLLIVILRALGILWGKECKAEKSVLPFKLLWV